MTHRFPRLVALALSAGALLLACSAAPVGPEDHEGDVASSTAALTTANKLLAVGRYHACAVLPNHTVSCWGDNTQGQLGDGTTTSRGFPMVVPSLTNVVSITAGQHHTCALDNVGQVKCWGYNVFGQIGDGSTLNRPTPVTVAQLGVAVAVDAGATHTCALTSTGTVRCWGWNSSGQLGNGSTWNSPLPVNASGLTNVKSISAGYSHTCAVDAHGATWCWGNNSYGQSSGAIVPTIVPGVPEAISVTAGTWHTCATSSSGLGQTFCWGLNAQGQLGRSTGTAATAPPAISGWPARQVVAGDSHTCELMFTGLLLCSGKNDDGRLGIGPTPTSTSVFYTTQQADVLEVAAGYQNTCILRTNGSVACTGDNSHGQLGDSTTTPANTFRAVPSLGSNRLQIASGGGLSWSYLNEVFYETGYTCAVTAQGRSFCWGDARAGQFGIGSDARRSMPVETFFPNVRLLRNGPLVQCTIDNQNRLFCAGDNHKGQLGRGWDGTDEYAMAQVTNGTTVVDVGMSEDTMCFIRFDGTVWCAGKTSPMIPSVASSFTPIQVPAISDAIGITSGETGICILHANGTVTCWGFPVDTSGVTDAVEITAGESNVCILRANGMLRCLGNDYAGQSGGTGDILSDVVKVELGYLFGCALRNDGKIWCWGRNNNGELCRTLTGTTFSRVPAPINSTDRFIDVTAGGQVGCGVTTTGVVKCWGDTLFVGDGSPGPLAASAPHTVTLPY